MSAEPFHIVIPARFAATRLPGKPLIDLAGRPMILRVLDVARRAGGGGEVIVATDDPKIAGCVRADGGVAIETRTDHMSGTDRIAEVAALKGWGSKQIIVNLQGDEPAMPPGHLRRVVACLTADPEAGIATLVTPFGAAEDVQNPNHVKAVVGEGGRALYFSRAAIPYRRAAEPSLASLRHIGLYAYRVATLKALTALPPAPLERAEGLEQLRALSAGMKIATSQIDIPPPPGVDTPEDVAHMQAFFAD